MLDGVLRFEVDGKQTDVRAGDAAFFVPPRAAHRFGNPGQADARYLQEFRPGLHIDRFFEALFALGRDGELNATGSPGLLHVAVLVPEHSDEIRLVSPPWPVVWAISAVLRPVARLLGYRPDYR